MKKKVAISSILTSNPEVILFDEPLNNLDPKMQSFMIDLLIKLNEAGKTVIVTTHNPFIITEIDPSVVIVYPDHRVKKYESFKDIYENEFIKAELVYEHSHFHNGVIHRHLHLFFHSHNDIK